MYAQVAKPKENKSRAVTNTVVQKTNILKPEFGLVDNRPEAVVQRKLQEMANYYSPQVSQLKAIQDDMAEHHSSQQKQPIQKKENNTGLPDSLKSGFETLSGDSMDDVQVHYNSDKPAQLQAHAYAQGTDIHLVTGQEKHLGHEAWHVVQKEQGRVKPTMQMKGKENVNDENDLEKEADVMGSKAVSIVDNGSSFISQSKQHEKDKHNNTNHELVNTRLKTASSVEEDSNDSKSVMQLAKLNLRKDGTISGVRNFISRPSSNLRGKQGQHLTAYVVFKDMIKTRVQDRTVKEAAEELIKVLEEISNLPRMKVKSSEYLKKAITVEIKKLSDKKTDVNTVGAVIDNILKIRNQVPGTAKHGTGGGKGESSTSGVLRTVETALLKGSWKKEWTEKEVKEKCLKAVWRLLDYNPSNPTKQEEKDEIATTLVTHFKSIMSAYPNTEKWLRKRGAFFTEYLLAHRQDDGIPLKKVIKLKEIFQLMNSKW